MTTLSAHCFRAKSSLLPTRRKLVANLYFKPPILTAEQKSSLPKRKVAANFYDFSGEATNENDARPLVQNKRKATQAFAETDTKKAKRSVERAEATSIKEIASEAPLCYAEELSPPPVFFHCIEEDCAFVSKTKTRMQAHWDTEHGAEHLLKDAALYQCGFCAYYCYRPREFDQHTQTCVRLHKDKKFSTSNRSSDQTTDDSDDSIESNESSGVYSLQVDLDASLNSREDKSQTERKQDSADETVDYDDTKKSLKASVVSTVSVANAKEKSSSSGGTPKWFSEPRKSRWWKFFVIDGNELHEEVDSEMQNYSHRYFTTLHCLEKENNPKKFFKLLKKDALCEADCAQLLADYYEQGYYLKGKRFLSKNVQKARKWHKNAIRLASVASPRQYVLETKSTTELLRLNIDNIGDDVEQTFALLPRFNKVLLEHPQLSAEQLCKSFLTLGDVYDEICANSNNNLLAFDEQQLSKKLRAAVADCYLLAAKASLQGSEYARVYLLTANLDALISDGPENCNKVHELFAQTDPQQLYDWYTSDETDYSAAQLLSIDREHATLLHCLSIYMDLVPNDIALSRQLQERAVVAGYDNNTKSNAQESN